MPGAFADLTKLSKKYVKNMVPYTIDVGADENGVLRALSHQAYPVAFAYKKGVSQKYLGTSDPSKIFEMLSTELWILTYTSSMSRSSKI